MERKVGDTFEYNGVMFRVEKETHACSGCYFHKNPDESCTCVVCRSIRGEGQSASRSDGGIIFVKIEDMEERIIKLTLEKAREFYKKGGEFKDLALSAFTEEELTKVELPKTWEEFCSKYGVQNEYYIGSDSTIKRAHLALIKLHQLRDCYRQGWKPDWLDDDNKYCIVYNSVYNYSISINKSTRVFLSFQSREVAQLFLDNFRNLIEETGDLI